MAPNDKSKSATDTKTDATETTKVDDSKQSTEPKLTPVEALYKRIIDNIHLLYRSVHNREYVLILRVLRTTFNSSSRALFNSTVLSTVNSDFYSELNSKYINRISNSAMDTGDSTDVLQLKRVYSTPITQLIDENISLENNSKMRSELVQSSLDENISDNKLDEARPEINTYLHLLTLMYILDSDKSNTQLAVECATDLYKYIEQYNRRSLDWLSSKVYFYYTLAHERQHNLEQIRSQLLQSHRTTTLQHNEPGTAALTVCILRNYLSYNLYQQADTFRLKSVFPEARSNNLLSRYLYYIARIDAIQLHYTSAYNNISQALRKIPQKKNVAVGFRLSVTKLYIVVQLCMGDIPEKAIFATTDLKHQLVPYYELTKAVRVGDLELFNQCLTKYKSIYETDQLNTFVIRLRNNVIKAGLRKISLAYSKISISDICKRLGLDSIEDTEYIVVKAISDNVIDATIDYSTGTVISHDTYDIYSTNEPQQQFHKRITFCLDLHNEAVKAMRYPSNLNKLLALTEAGFDDADDSDDEGLTKAAISAAQKEKEKDGNPKK